MTITQPTARATTPTHDDDAVGTALLTALFAGTRVVADDVTSARAAYQDALYGRAALVDLRPVAARLRGGRLGLPAIVLDTDHGDALTQVERLASSGPVVLVSTDGTLATRIAAHLRRLGLTWVDAVDGGYAAWRRAGLPIADAA